MTSTRKVNKKHLVPSAQCNWGLLCSLSAIDQERNNISLFNVIEQLTLKKRFFSEQKKINKPLLLPILLEVVLSWGRTLNPDVFDDEIVTDFKLKIIDPFGKVLQETVSSLKIEKQKRRTRFRVRMNALPLTVHGDYRFDIEVMGHSKDSFQWAFSIPLEIRAKQN